MWLVAARAAYRASKHFKNRQGILQLCAMVTTQAPPAVPDKLQMYVDTVTITDGQQNNGAPKVVNTKQVPVFCIRLDLVYLLDQFCA